VLYSEKGLVSGIVQDSCLEPLLLLAYVNDVTDILPSHCTSKLLVDWSSMFSFNSASITRGHSYKLFGKTSRVNIRRQFFCNLVVNVPATDVNFKSFSAFKTFFSNIDLSAYLRK